jgi:acetyl-CoA carboxylase biotin carboxyl carrier protein
MSLTAAEIAEIMRLIEHSRFDELSLDMDGVRLTLRRTGASGSIVQSTDALQDAASSAPPASPAPRAAAAVPTVSAPVEPGLGDITSPMLGTFYRAPKPGSAPFVEVGSRVEPDTVIAIIEVMKLMNTVRAGIKGTIAEILPADETLVEFGQPLMRVRRDS